MSSSGDLFFVGYTRVVQDFEANFSTTTSDDMKDLKEKLLLKLVEYKSKEKTNG
jgi:hypothetical protein